MRRGTTLSSIADSRRSSIREIHRAVIQFAFYFLGMSDGPLECLPLVFHLERRGVLLAGE